jgi:hypothetical protein
MRKAKVRVLYLDQDMATHSLVYLNHQISVHAADVKQVLRVYSLDVPAREKDDLKEEPIIIKLRKVRSASLCIVCGNIDHDANGALVGWWC